MGYRHWGLWEAKEFWAGKGGSARVTKPSDIFKRQNPTHGGGQGDATKDNVVEL